MAEAAGILKWLRAVVPALKPRSSGETVHSSDNRAAPVYVPARRGAQPHRRGGSDSGSPKGSAQR